MNPILQLAENIRNATNRLCEVGPGPYGFGVHTDENSEIYLGLSFTPDPVTDNVIFSDKIDDYEVKVDGFHREEREPISMEEIAAYATSEQASDATRLVAGAILALGKEQLHVTTEECNEAFDIMAKYALDNKKCSFDIGPLHPADYPSAQMDDAAGQQMQGPALTL